MTALIKDPPPNSKKPLSPILLYERSVTRISVGTLFVGMTYLAETIKTISGFESPFFKPALILVTLLGVLCAGRGITDLLEARKADNGSIKQNDSFLLSTLKDSTVWTFTIVFVSLTFARGLYEFDLLTMPIGLFLDIAMALCMITYSMSFTILMTKRGLGAEENDDYSDLDDMV